MIERFILKNARETFKIASNNHFKRYDLRSEWDQLNNYTNYFKAKIGREPFMYDLLDTLLMNLEDTTKNEVKSILYNKENEWFLKIGQYFLYNAYQWMEKYNYSAKESLKEESINLFLEKWWNKFLEIEGNRNKLKKNENLPNKVLLELTNNCNLNCIMCGIGKKGYDPSRNLSIDLLHSLCEDVLNEAKLIRLNGLGESTILPNFFEYIDILSELSAQLEIVTNLTVANKNIWEKLIKNNTNFLISCDSSSAKLFESIRRGVSFQNFKRNLKYIGKNISNPLQGQIIFTLMECNISELYNVVKLAADMDLGGVIVNVVKMISNDYGWIYQYYENIVNEFQRAYKVAESNDIILKLPDHLDNLPINRNISNPTCQFYCNNPWEEIYVRYNGDLTVCNMLNPYIYGNCQYYPFDKIWNGLNAEMFRTFVNTEFRHYYCKDCYYLI
ncbi:MAG: radical SAM protein [Candidatus Thorarchaeota archaeon]